LQSDPEDYLKSQAGGASGLSDVAIDEMIAQRLQARESRDWASADKIRDQLISAGITIEDSSEGTTWRRN